MEIYKLSHIEGILLKKILLGYYLTITEKILKEGC